MNVRVLIAVLLLLQAPLAAEAGYRWSPQVMWRDLLGPISLMPQVFPSPGPRARRAAGGGVNPIVNWCFKDNGGFSGTSFVLNSCATGGSLNHTAGNLLYVILTFQQACTDVGTYTITDAAGDATFTPIDAYSALSAICLKTLYVQSTAGNSANAITFSYNGTSVAFSGAGVIQVTGQASSALDVSNKTNQAIATSLATGSFTTTTAHQIIFIPAASNGGSSWTAGLIGGVTGTIPTGGISTTLGTLTVNYREVTSTQTSITGAVGNSSTRIAINANSFKLL